jgi:hypothetical protein
MSAGWRELRYVLYRVHMNDIQNSNVFEIDLEKGRTIDGCDVILIIMCANKTSGVESGGCANPRQRRT